MESRKENVVIFPFMAQGHIIPFLALALHIEKTKSYTVTFINTPNNVKKLKSSLPPSSSIVLKEIPLSSAEHGLPPGTENTDTLPYRLIGKLLDASLSLRTSFRDIIIELQKQGNDPDCDHGPPLCIIADIFFGWTATVAKELGVFHAVFSGASGYGLACYYSLWMNLPHRKTEESVFSLPDFPEISKLDRSQLPSNILLADGSDDWSIFQSKNLPFWSDSNGILFNTVEEFDHTGFVYFRRKLGRPVWPIGPVLLPTVHRSTVNANSNNVGCIEWLNTKPKNSVLYVSFGSMNTISASQMMQLAMALELSEKDFIWVVRPPMEFDINSEFKGEEWLPQGFESRIKDSKRGLLVHKWAPQLEILSHEAVSAFLTHCGWNSVLEALSHGVPLLGWPMAAEQFMNVKFLEEDVGVCVEVARGKGSSIEFRNLSEKIEMVMMGETEKGKEMRRRASEVRMMIENAMKSEGDYKGSSLRGLDNFFESALQMREEGGKMKQNGTKNGF